MINLKLAIKGAAIYAVSVKNLWNYVPRLLKKHEFQFGIIFLFRIFEQNIIVA